MFIFSSPAFLFSNFEAMKWQENANRDHCIFEIDSAWLFFLIHGKFGFKQVGRDWVEGFASFLIRHRGWKLISVRRGQLKIVGVARPLMRFLFVSEVCVNNSESQCSCLVLFCLPFLGLFVSSLSKKLKIIISQLFKELVKVSLNGVLSFV